MRTNPACLPQTTPNPDLAAVKARQRATWSAGDFAVIGVTLQLVGESLCESVDVRSGQTVLDVAAGNGNATLAAARRFARVTSTDYVPALLARGAERAQAEGLAVEFVEADAEDLPFPAGSFDAVLSTFGVMFTPDQERAASELLRVCRSGGKIGLANWTAEGFLGELFRVVARHVPPPAGLRSPMLWGDEQRLRELFGNEAASLSFARREFLFRYESAAHWIEVFRTWYGPVRRAFEALEADGARALERDLTTLLTRLDRGGGAGLVVPGEYAEVVIVRR
ncbi:MAG: class I SAM-dependent methyltransferase [Planctomycetes bacterium]|nr:class I SAM-dependent methyltransferase [Planctomycetota bacterium]